MSYTAHVDTFAYQSLPRREQWPKLIFELPELQYPERINCGTELLDRALDRGFWWTTSGSSRVTACCYADRTIR